MEWRECTVIPVSRQFSTFAFTFIYWPFTSDIYRIAHQESSGIVTHYLPGELRCCNSVEQDRHLVEILNVLGRFYFMNISAMSDHYKWIHFKAFFRNREPPSGNLSQLCFICSEQNPINASHHKQQVTMREIRLAIIGWDSILFNTLIFIFIK